MTVLQTDRLLLRPFVLDDAPAVAELCSAREIAAGTMLVPHPYTLRDADAFVRSIEGTLRRHTLKWGELLDSDAFGILASEWPGTAKEAAGSRRNTST